MSFSSQICPVDELKQRLAEPCLKVVDGSWYLPSAQRDVQREYQADHIDGAVFFDIDAISDTQSDLPHMLPSVGDFSKLVSELGIDNHDELVVYDSAGLFSAARVWWMFKVFGHDRVRVLNGGLPAWKRAGGLTTNTSVSVSSGAFTAVRPSEAVVTQDVLLQNCQTLQYCVLDARSADRFYGRAPEPRPGLPSGHIPGSVSLPFDQLLDHGCLRSRAQLNEIFARVSNVDNPQFVSTCGSGVTAAIITLALCEAGYGLQRLYDGAWAEWAATPGSPVDVE